jgi:hypothetical protein
VPVPAVPRAAVIREHAPQLVLSLCLLLGYPVYRILTIVARFSDLGDFMHLVALSMVVGHGVSWVAFQVR